LKSLKDILNEEDQLVLNRFDEDVAREIGEMAVKKAVKKELPVAVRVEREGQILFQTSLKGTGPDNDMWLSGKARVVHYFHHSSFYISRKMIEAGLSLEEKYFLDPSLYRAKGGAVPLFIQNGGLAGVLIISGLEDHLDHELCMEVVREYQKRKQASPTP